MTALAGLRGAVQGFNDGVAAFPAGRPGYSGGFP